MLLHSTEVNVYKKPWVGNFLDFMVYCMPPGSPNGVFGDGAKKSNVIERSKLTEAYALRMPSKMSNWYTINQTGADMSQFLLLSALPIPDIPDNFQSYPPSIPNAAYFSSIGWTAMHSDLADPNRVSIYFKSSPFGSFNHSHADQNSFVINANGKALAIDSGYYDWYGSPHWSNWYNQTLAHNGITFNGGTGQKINDKGAVGEIIHFEHNKQYDVVVGEASQAFKGELIKARRTMAYIRPGTIVVYDRLSSKNRRSWEWNIHSLSKMEKIDQRTIKIANQGTKLCVQILEPQDLSFNQTDQFTESPDFSDRVVANQWHGRFTTMDKTKDNEFLAVMQVNCQANNLVNDVGYQRGQYVVTLKSVNATVKIGENGAELFPLTLRN